MLEQRPLNDAWVGQSPARVDGAAKVGGVARYIADIDFPGVIDAAVVRSEIPRGLIRSVTLDPSFDWSEVTIATADDVPCNEMALIEFDQPVLAKSEIRHSYEPIVLLCCADPVKLARARMHVQVEVDALPAVLSMDDALAAKTVIAGTDNVIKRYKITRGDALDAMNKGEVIIRGTYDVGHQEQLYIEPQGCVAYWTNAELRVVGSFQCPHYVQKALAHAFQLPKEKIDVSQAVTGGAFGGKEEYPSVIAVHAALLARKSGKPVRILYDRKEDIEATTKRHPARTQITTSCDRNGILGAIHIQTVMDAGAYVTLTPVVLSRGTLHACGAYKWQDVLVEASAVATNTPPTGAFRGFGAPQTIFAVERHLDKIAAELGLDPLELRKRNLLCRGATMPTGQVLETPIALDECVRRAEQESDYWNKRKAYGMHARQPEAHKVRGIGASVFLHGAGFTGSGEDRLKGEVAVDLLARGRLRVRSGSTDMGQGTETVFRQIAATAAEVPFADVDVAVPSTAHVPDSGPTVASRTVMIVGSLVEQASRGVAQIVRDEMHKGGGSFADAADRLLAKQASITCQRQYHSPPGVHFDDVTYSGTAYPAYAWACDVAEVEVDLDTFEITVLGFWSCVDVGKAIHPVMCKGQLEGGALQAIGWALWEEVKWKDGRILNPRMTTYIVPTILDAPRFHTSLVEEPYAHGPFGAKGIGELPMDGGAPAIAAAIEHATGLSFASIPITPELVYDAWLAHDDKEAI